MSKKNQWFISIKKNDRDLFNLDGLKHNYPPEGKYWADPFLYQRDGKDYVFYELYDYEKGVIAYSEINEDMSFSEPTIVLELPHHISYPSLFEDGGELYMVPECGASKTIDLFKCTSFPNKWEHEKTIATNIIAGDTNIFKLADRYWLFTTAQPQLKHNLVVYTSESLLGDWQLLISQEVENSRSGGKIFDYGGKLIRTVQDGIGGYGSGIIFKSMTIDLENLIFEENILSRINPDWHDEIFGTHHFDFNDKYVVIDGKRKVENFLAEEQDSNLTPSPFGRLSRTDTGIFTSESPDVDVAFDGKGEIWNTKHGLKIK
tara:strand:- start:17 stop:967 length:951 start_codon:yes stop_codon:yes gene_type:complete